MSLTAVYSEDLQSFNIDHKNINNDLKLREFISIKFPFGWMLGLDAFTAVKIEDIETDLCARKF